MYQPDSNPAITLVSACIRLWLPTKTGCAVRDSRGLQKQPESWGTSSCTDLPQWVKEDPCHLKRNAIQEAGLAFRESKDPKFRSVSCCWRGCWGRP
ncbi:hypothetical protein ACVWWC_002388 [Thermostichus sp. MS-CIW-32]